MKSLKIDLDYLIFAYQDASPDNVYYLDTEFGDVVLVNPNLADYKDLTDQLETSRGRFLYIPKSSKEEIKNNLHDFHESVSDPQLKNVLEIAFESPHIEAAFRKILAKDKEEMERFDRFLHDRARTKVLKWLQANAL